MATHCLEGKAGEASPAEEVTHGHIRLQEEQLSGETEHQSAPGTSAVLDTSLLRDDNEINPAWSHFPSP